MYCATLETSTHEWYRCLLPVVYFRFHQRQRCFTACFPIFSEIQRMDRWHLPAPDSSDCDNRAPHLHGNFLVGAADRRRFWIRHTIANSLDCIAPFLAKLPAFFLGHAIIRRRDQEHHCSVFFCALIHERNVFTRASLFRFASRRGRLLFWRHDHDRLVLFRQRQLLRRQGLFASEQMHPAADCGCVPNFS